MRGESVNKPVVSLVVGFALLAFSPGMPAALAQGEIISAFPGSGPGTGFDPQAGLRVPLQVPMHQALVHNAGGGPHATVDGGTGNVFIFVTFADDDNEGFFDETFGQRRRTAFLFALQIWAQQLQGSAIIEVQAAFDPLGGGTGAFILGQASPNGFFLLNANDGIPNIFYPAPLANNLTGQDVNGFTAPEIVATFNSDVDTDDVPNFSWYYGLDANPGGNQADFVTVVLHEVCHGLGFVDSYDGFSFGLFTFSGLNFSTLPVIYDVFLVNGDGERLLNFESSSSLGIGNNVFWDGVNAVQAYQDSFDAEPNVPLFAPTPFQPGSSIAHLDENTFSGPFELMTPFSSGAIHTPDPIILGMLKDMGWNGGGQAPDDFEPPDLADDPFDDHPDTPPECTGLSRVVGTESRFGTLFEAQGDTDSFCFTLVAGDEVTVTLIPSSPFDNAVLTVLRPDGTSVIDSVDARDVPSNEDMSITYTVTQPGVNFAVVSSNGTAPSPTTFSYELRVTVIPAQTDDEPTDGGSGLAATARATPTVGVAPLSVRFSGGTNATDIILREWDFGDGTFGTAAIEQHTYVFPGSFTAVFKVVDSQGRTATASAVVNVQDTENQLPSANISASTTAGDVPLTVQFTGSGQDPDGETVRFEWYFGDGATAGGAQVEHTFLESGVFNVVLTVEDSRGGTSTAQITVQAGVDAIVDDIPPGQVLPPVAPMCGSINGLTLALLAFGLCGLGLRRRR